MSFNIVSNLSDSFNPCPKAISKEKKKNTQIKKKSSKLAKKEKERFSILQEDTNSCWLCGKYVRKADKHEVFGGFNRQKSMEFGMIINLCRECHQKVDVNKNVRDTLHSFAKVQFIKKYGKEKFIKEFGKNYMSEYERKEKIECVAR